MRSSKSRSRSKSNRQRSPLGNIVNRVFDSSGPEGKVRGTPQQIIDKYLALARDAQLSNDRVAAENFLQHAEHYARLLGEAQREQEAMRASQGGGEGNGEEEFRAERREGPREGQNQLHQRNGHGQPRDGMGRDERGREDRGGSREDREREPRRAEPVAAEVIDFGEPSDSGLVETPETRAGSDAPAGHAPGDATTVTQAPAPRDDAAATAEGGRSRRPRRPRGERRAGGTGTEGGTSDGGTETAGGAGSPETSEAAE